MQLKLENRQAADSKKWEADSVRRPLCRRVERASHFPEIFPFPSVEDLVIVLSLLIAPGSDGYNSMCDSTKSLLRVGMHGWASLPLGRTPTGELFGSAISTPRRFGGSLTLPFSGSLRLVHPGASGSMTFQDYLDGG